MEAIRIKNQEIEKRREMVALDEKLYRDKVEFIAKEEQRLEEERKLEEKLTAERKERDQQIYLELRY
jgi:hypothetical protein